MHTVKQSEVSSDLDLINKIIAGEKGLFETLIRENNPFLYKTGMSYGFNHHDTEDLMQEAFIAAYINLKNFQQRCSFKTWVIQIMIHLCYKKAQKLSFKNEKPGNAALKEKAIPMFTNYQTRDTSQTVLNRELIHVIETALTSIPIDYRMVFSLRELSGLSTSETAEALTITETNVKVRLNRAKHMLRKKIEQLYSTEDIFEFNLIYCNKVTHHVMQVISNTSNTE
jgi:RNA polymerase sigma-70 factor (ECF subfamily)